MLLYWLMGKQEQGKPTLWKAMNTEKQMGKQGQQLRYITQQDGKHAGIIPRVFKSLMAKLEGQSEKYSIESSFIQIYNEKIYDLLCDCNYDSEEGIPEAHYKIRYADNEFYVDKLPVKECGSYKQVYFHIAY